jgi:hypothetical protein
MSLWWQVIAELLRRGTWWQAEWVRVYDGEANPLGRAYSRREVCWLLRHFHAVQIRLCDPIRRRFPGWVNALNQLITARVAGFYLLARARKGAG